ncbi:MAG: adenylate/guanylate cyclase domain-containing protein [Nitriliruptorales bacterium]|nr:adenylate/guanylate cyclase domain-containing protein [Nitriliruptorales bacterium]
MTDTALATCRSCGTENPAVARFCMSCGGSLEVPCANCGTELPPAASFCFACGHEIEAGSTAAEPGRSTQDVTDSIAAQLAEVTAGAGERRTVTMLFCDVKDSTATAEKLDPEAWTVIMHETMACFTGAVERYGGTVARLLGDAVLAYFGAPEAHEDDPQRALLAALTIRDDTRDLCQRVRDEHGTDFDVRIGINTGLVVVGEVGSDTYGEYAALGDAANVAARMEQTAEPGTIRIAEPTYKLIAPLFEVEAVGSIEVKGRSEPIAAYEVLAALGTPGQVRGVEGLSAPLVGRADELAELEGALRAVRGGAGRIVSLVAEAGLGKSRLAAELRREASDDDGLEWISGQCHSYDDATPYAPFVSALHDCFGLDVATPPRDRAGALIEAATDLMGQEHRDHAVYLCSMLGLPVPADDREAVAFLDPATLRGRIFDAVSALVGALAARGTVVLELEDLHWADATSIELLEHLLPVTERHGVLLLLLFRPRRDEPSWRVHEVAARDHAHRYVPVELHPLPDDDARELVGHLLRVEGLSPRVRETILRKSEGNPFFVEEVIRSLLDAGIIVRENDRFIATEDVDDISVPDTLAAVLATRLDRLDAPVRKVVQTASVLGRDFSLGTLAALVDPGVDLDVVVADLLRRELLVEADSGDRDRTLRFKHALTRDTAYGTLLLSVRRDLHRIVGKLIEERDPDRVFDLSRHFDEADEPMKAVPYLVAAGEKAFGAFSREDAVSFFRRALELWDDTHDIAFARRAYEGLGNALFYLGRPADAVATFEEMLDFAREHGDAAAEVSALNKAGFAALAGLGAVDRAEELMLAAKELAEREDLQTGVAEFHVGYCFLNVSQGRLDRAERYLGEAAEVCFSLDAHHRNFGLVHFANALIYQTRLDEAREALARAREQAELDGDLEHLAEAMAGDAMVDFVCGDPVTAGQKLQEPLELGARIGAIRGLTMTAWVAGSAALSRGELDLAREHFHTAVAKGTASGNTGPAAASLVGLGTIEQLVHGPDASSVEEYFDQARELHTTPIARASTAAIFSQMGFDHLLAGKLDAAESALRIAEEVPSATSKLMAPEVLLCGGGLAMARGDTEEAAELYDRAMAVVEESGLDLFRPRALLGQAVVASVEGDQEQFRALLEEAEQEAIDRVLRIDELVIQRTGADLYAAAGLDAAAAELREHATATVADIAGGLEDAGERREFLRTNTVTG